MSPVKDGPSCPGCGLPNYEGLCPVCRGDEEATRAEGLPYPFRDEERPPLWGEGGPERGFEFTHESGLGLRWTGTHWELA